jgi:hypothetical protein
MSRLISFTLFFTVVCCISCKEKEKEKEKEPENPISKRYVVGNYYNIDGVQGIVYKTNGTTGMIISLDEATYSWSNEKVKLDARDFENGMKNLEKIIEKGISNYPAFDWCNKKNTGSISGWYLPAVEELNTILQTYNKFQDSLAAYKGTKLDENGRYWSSTEGYMLAGDSDIAFYVEHCGFTWQGSTDKNDQNKVRAVRAF